MGNAADVERRAARLGVDVDLTRLRMARRGVAAAARKRGRVRLSATLAAIVSALSGSK